MSQLPQSVSKTVESIGSNAQVKCSMICAVLVLIIASVQNYYDRNHKQPVDSGYTTISTAGNDFLITASVLMIALQGILLGNETMKWGISNRVKGVLTLLVLSATAIYFIVVVAKHAPKTAKP